jgi:hypothetical protein
MDEQKQELAMTKGTALNEHYINIAKVLKNFEDLLPGVIAEDGSIVALEPKDMQKNKLSERQAEATLKMSDGTATEDDMRLVALTEGDKDMIAAAIVETNKRLKEQKKNAKDPNVFIETFNNVIQSMFAPMFKHRKGLEANEETMRNLQQRQQSLTQPQQPSANPNTNALADPLGAFGR